LRKEKCVAELIKGGTVQAWVPNINHLGRQPLGVFAISVALTLCGIGFEMIAAY